LLPATLTLDALRAIYLDRPFAVKDAVEEVLARVAMAQDPACASKAVGKDGRPLAGAAKTSFMNKCCEDSAVSKDGKPLSGAAKTSFVKKCTSG